MIWAGGGDNVCNDTCLSFLFLDTWVDVSKIMEDLAVDDEGKGFKMCKEGLNPSCSLQAPCGTTVRFGRDC